MTDLSALIERVEGLDGPSREVGEAVLLFFGWKKSCIGHFHGPMYYWSAPDGRDSFDDDDFVRLRKDPTASLDAAIALCERVGEDPTILLPEAIEEMLRTGYRLDADVAGQFARALVLATLRAVEG